jgi:threonylcarbamoyladenosine tRNA methylthiotransferase MtaB
LRVVEEAAFADAHVFPYSSRPGTTAAYLPGHLPAAVRSERAAELRAVAGRSAADFRRWQIGAVRPVLWEGRGRAEGLTDNYVRVRREGPGAGTSRIEPVLLIGVDGDVMVGSPVTPP